MFFIQFIIPLCLYRNRTKIYAIIRYQITHTLIVQIMNAFHDTVQNFSYFSMLFKHLLVPLESAVPGGGGGYGDPAKRAVELVRRDLVEERISREYAERDYPAQLVAIETVQNGPCPSSITDSTVKIQFPVMA